MIIGHFIRGGQLINHSFKMNCQIWIMLARFTAVMILISLSYSFYKHMSTNDWKNISAYIKKEFGFNDDSLIEYYNRYGVKSKQPRRFAKNHPVFKDLEKKFSSLFFRGLKFGILFSSFLIISSIFIFYRTGQKRTKNIVIRGTYLDNFKNIKKMVNRHNKPFDYVPVKIANMPYPITGSKSSGYTSGEQSHTMIIGSTGSGKTTAIRNLLWDIHKKGSKAIIVDVKGDYIQKFYHSTNLNTNNIILNPFDRRSRNWSIFNETDALFGFSTIAKALIPTDTKDPTWTEAARIVFTEVANSYASANLSMGEFVDKLLKTDLQNLCLLLKKTYAEKIINKNIEKAALSVMMVLSTYIRPLKLYTSNKDCFSIRNWILNESNNERSFLFLSSQAEAKRDINPIINVQVDIAINSMRSMKNESSTPKLWFILDELSYFDSPIPNLVDGLTIGRSYGGCFVLGIQDITTLSRIYSKEQSETITNNCRTKLFMNVEGSCTSKWCSNNIGNGEVEEWSESFSYGAHQMRDGKNATRRKIIRSAVMDGEFHRLLPGEGYMKLSGYNPFRFETYPKRIPNVSDAHQTNESLLNVLLEERSKQEKYREELESKLFSDFPYNNSSDDLESNLSNYDIKFDLDDFL